MPSFQCSSVPRKLIQALRPRLPLTSLMSPLEAPPSWHLSAAQSALLRALPFLEEQSLPKSCAACWPADPAFL